MDENPTKQSFVLVRADFLQSAKDFSLEEISFLKRKTEVTFIAKNPRQSPTLQTIKESDYF
jgi:hypothetical protein